MQVYVDYNIDHNENFVIHTIVEVYCNSTVLHVLLLDSVGTINWFESFHTAISFKHCIVLFWEVPSSV